MATQYSLDATESVSFVRGLAFDKQTLAVFEDKVLLVNVVEPLVTKHTSSRMTF